MAKSIEMIIKENIPAQAIAKAIRAEGYRIPTGGKKKDTGAGFGEGYIINLLRSPDRIIQLKDGWFKDVVWGIDWAPKSLEKKLQWQEAKEYCAQFGRLPEHYELESLRDLAKYNPAVIESATKLELQSSYYWSGTTCAYDSGSAWGVYFYYGNVYYDGKGGSYYVRPVRASE